MTLSFKVFILTLLTSELFCRLGYSSSYSCSSISRLAAVAAAAVGPLDAGVKAARVLLDESAQRVLGLAVSRG